MAGRYYFRCLPRREIDEVWYETHMLVELTPSEKRELDARQGPALDRYDPCYWQDAHDWVRRGRLHGTGLYTDEGRIRYASDGF